MCNITIVTFAYHLTLFDVHPYKSIFNVPCSTVHEFYYITTYKSSFYRYIKFTVMWLLKKKDSTDACIFTLCQNVEVLGLKANEISNPFGKVWPKYRRNNTLLCPEGLHIPHFPVPLFLHIVVISQTKFLKKFVINVWCGGIFDPQIFFTCLTALDNFPSAGPEMGSEWALKCPLSGAGGNFAFRKKHIGGSEV